jgi:hypothetical protein
MAPATIAHDKAVYVHWNFTRRLGLPMRCPIPMPGLEGGLWEVAIGLR